MRVVVRAIEQLVRRILIDPPEPHSPHDPVVGFGQETIAVPTWLLSLGGGSTEIRVLVSWRRGRPPR